MFSTKGQAQVHVDCPEVNLDSLYQVNLETKIPLNVILGNWISNDSLASKITFEDDGYHVNILPKIHVNSYCFRKDKDSIVASGGALNWPPYYCVITLINDQMIEIKYFSFSYQEMHCRTYIKEK